jgi:hypothetical protein
LGKAVHEFSAIPELAKPGADKLEVELTFLCSAEWLKHQTSIPTDTQEEYLQRIS